LNKKSRYIIKNIAAAIIVTLGILAYQGVISRTAFSNLMIAILVMAFAMELAIKYILKNKE
jgi:formate/nitrite transporter FocA (FNT family)